MVERRRAHIIVMTSIAAREVYRLGVIYCATKHALSAFARGLRIELQGHGTKVTEIAPGMVDTEIRADSVHPSVLAALAARKFEALLTAGFSNASFGSPGLRKGRRPISDISLCGKKSRSWRRKGVVARASPRSCRCRMRTPSEICKCEEVESGLGQTKPLNERCTSGARQCL